MNTTILRTSFVSGPLAGMKNERGEITKGRLFKLDEEQASVIGRASKYHQELDAQGRVKGFF